MVKYSYYVCKIPEPCTIQYFDKRRQIETRQPKTIIQQEFQPVEEGYFGVIRTSIHERVYMYIFETTVGASKAKKGQDIEYVISEVSSSNILEQSPRMTAYEFPFDTTPHYYPLFEKSLDQLCESDVLQQLISLPDVESRKRKLLQDEIIIKSRKRELCMSDALFKRIEIVCKPLGFVVKTQSVLSELNYSKFNRSEADLILYHGRKYCCNGTLSGAIIVQGLEYESDTFEYYDEHASLIGSLFELTIENNKSQKITQGVAGCIQVSSHLTKQALINSKEVKDVRIYGFVLNAITNYGILIELYLDYIQQACSILEGDEEITLDDATNRIVHKLNYSTE